MLFLIPSNQVSFGLLFISNYLFLLAVFSSLTIYFSLDTITPPHYCLFWFSIYAVVSHFGFNWCYRKLFIFSFIILSFFFCSTSAQASSSRQQLHYGHAFYSPTFRIIKHELYYMYFVNSLFKVLGILWLLKTHETLPLLSQ